MSDALGAAPQPPRPPGASAEAGAGGQRPLQQALLQQQTAATGVGNVPASTARPVVVGASGSSPRLSGQTITSLPAGVRFVGSNVQFPGSSPRLLLSVDSANVQQNMPQQPQSSWISINSPSLLTGTPRRTVSAAMGTPTPATTSSPSSILRPIPSSSSSSFATPSPAKRHIAATSVSPTSTTVRKRLKLDPEEQEDLSVQRRRLLEHKAQQLRESRDVYTELLAELFFLQAGGNMMDYHSWRKRPPVPQYSEFIRSRSLDDDTGELERLGVTAELRVAGPGATPVAVSTQLPAAVAQLSQQGQVPGRPQGGRHGMVYAPRPSINASPSSVSPSKPVVASPGTSSGNVSLVPGLPLSPVVTGPAVPGGSGLSSAASVAAATAAARALATTATSRPGPSTPGPSHQKQTTPRLTQLTVPVRQHTRQHSISAVYDTSIGSQEQIVEKAKQEAYVMQRVTELQRDGLWAEKRLPKVQEPSRAKAHWDYLLEEMVWLAADFAQERKWKKAAAKKCAKMVQKYFQDKAVQAQKAEKNHELRLKKIASCIAKEVKTFWNNVQKLVEYKHQTILEERRRQALDQHLSYIVDQTEKYSSWLAESMSKTGGPQSRPESKANSLTYSGETSTPEQRCVSDGEFEPNQSSSDDEETIAKAEAEDVGEEQSEELKMLALESTLPIDDVIKFLPAEVREAVQRSQPPSAASSSTLKSEPKDEEEKMEDGDFDASDEDSTDDEVTIQEQEKAEKDVDYKQELVELNEDNNLTVEELLAKYGHAGDSVAASSEQASEAEDNEEGDGNSASESDPDEEGSDNKDKSDDDKESNGEDDIALSSLFEDKKGITDVDKLAHTVEEYQPTGYTLSSTKVETKVPFLLKHELREYQHVGLEWLVTMYNKRLNGILADEMGLGKTIQTIALLAHLACDKCIWGPHLIIVPTSVMLNWEMEFKKWCPAFKILTYYGSQKERRLKRTGWTKPNAFHVCITSYKLVIQDHQSFRRKKWRYLILDEAQNIKNFKSQRWQLLLNFQSQRRLLLTGTPLQNSLMELWSLMHFLMPDVFQSHREFKEWFSNPVTGMIEGNSEYNESIIKRLHKVLRPFLLRRLKIEVERQLPKKYEHVVMCRLSKRQRFLYDDFMSRAKTRETLAAGNLLSVINVLMQLRKVCNHPNLFEVRPTISPFQMESITMHIPSLVSYVLEYNPLKHVSLNALNLRRIDFEYSTTAYMAHRIRRFATKRQLIEEIDSQPAAPPPCPKGKIRLNVRAQPPQPASQQTQFASRQGIIQAFPGTSPIVRALGGQPSTAQGMMLRVTGSAQAQSYSVQLVQHPEGVRAIPVAPLVSASPSTSTAASTAVTATNASSGVAQAIVVSSAAARPVVSAPVSSTGQQETGTTVTGIPTVVPRMTRPAGFAQLVQTATGKHILLTSSPQAIHHAPVAAPGTAGTASGNTTVLTSGGHRLTVLSKPAAGVITSTITPLNKVLPTQAASSASSVTTSQGTRPVMRVPPLHVTTAGTVAQQPMSRAQPTLVATTSVQQATMLRPAPPLATTTVLNARLLAMAENMKKSKEQPLQPQSIFHLTDLEESRKRERKSKLSCIATLNERRCESCPLYGSDLISALDTMDSAASMSNTLFSNFPWNEGSGLIHCLRAQQQQRHEELWINTDVLSDMIYSPEERVEQLKEIFSRYVMYIPPVNAPSPRLHASHASPSCVWADRRLQEHLSVELAPRAHLLHPVAGAMATQFPDPRLIQYDCGKLQTLEKLLRELKVGSHRVLIFTQMTRMLDVLEAFLNHQGHIYLRLDGTTKVEQRQLLMERFNADKRIFAFILSTRSGGIGVNLTGADTVVFYDSDWNPTMDAQAQDRCHRIGQTRDVHIYRLVSEKTVEENILKKANQKRLLGDLAIEGGNFTTAYFKSSTIQELFNVDVSENDASRRMAEVLDTNVEREKHRQQAIKEKEPEVPPEDRSAINNLENVLAAAEDEQDVQAARTARAEAAAELAEFDENIALEEEPSASTANNTQAGNAGEELSKAELEMQGIVEKLSPIERYAMRVVEESESAWSAEQLAAAEAEIEQQKRDWELGRLRALQEQQREEEEEEERLAGASPSDMLTYSSRDSHSQVNSNSRNRGRSATKQKLPASSRGVKRKHSNVEGKPQENGDVGGSSSSSSDDSSSDSSEDDDEPGSESLSPGNFIDPNSPRTRSRGAVKINLWTLDVSPILHGMKPVKPCSKTGKNIGENKSPVSPPNNTNCTKRTNNKGNLSGSDEIKGSDCSEGDIVALSNNDSLKCTPAKVTYTRTTRRSDCSNEGNGPVS